MDTFLEIQKKCLLKIEENTINDIVIASPSNDPPYRYYWIRDSALIYRAIISMYENSKKSDLLEKILIFQSIKTTFQAIYAKFKNFQF